MTPDDVAAQTTFSDFLKQDIRVGTVVGEELNRKSRNPALVLTIDFGPLGIKTSSAQLTENYTAELLVGRQVIALVNLPPKSVAGVRSECLVLAVLCGRAGTVLLQPERKVENGSRIA